MIYPYKPKHNNQKPKNRGNNHYFLFRDKSVKPEEGQVENDKKSHALTRGGSDKFIMINRLKKNSGSEIKITKKYLNTEGL